MENPNFKVKLVAEMIDQGLFTDPESRHEANEFLKEPYEEGYREAWCYCMQVPRRLEIIQRISSTVLFLRVEKGDRKNHHPKCGMRMKGEGIDIYCAVPKFKTDGDTTHLSATISLQGLMTNNASSGDNEEINSDKQTNIWNNKDRKRTGLGGLMNFVIIKSGLNYWSAYSTRTYSDYVHAIQNACKNVSIKNISLEDRICISGTGEHDTVNQPDFFMSSHNDFLIKLKRESDERGSTARGILFDEITGVKSADGLTTLTGKFLKDTVTVSNELAEKIKNSNAHEWASLGKDNRHVFGMFLISTNSDGRMQIEDASLFLTSRDYFNVEAYPEVVMVNRLIDESRCFMKPYRQWNESGFFPDFKLLDTREECLIEVWGMDTPRYIKQKKKKIKYYKEAKIKLIEWTVRKIDICAVVLPPADAISLT